MGVSIGVPTRSGSRSVILRSSISMYGTEEIEHER